MTRSWLGLPQLTDRLRSEPGFGLFTVLVWSPREHTLTRVHSTNQGTHPVGVPKDAGVGGPWLDQVLVRGEPFLGRGAEDLVAAYGDGPQLLEAGYGSALNVTVGGPAPETPAVLNLIGSPGQYNEHHLALLGALARDLAVLWPLHVTVGRPAAGHPTSRPDCAHLLIDAEGA